MERTVNREVTQQCPIRAELVDEPALTETPDASHAELDRLCRDDERLRVPPAVRSAARDRYEPLWPDQPAQ